MTGQAAPPPFTNELGIQQDNSRKCVKGVHEMAWTIPKTDWNNGDLVTADDMNAIGENLAAVRNLQKAPGAQFWVREI